MNKRKLKKELKRAGIPKHYYNLTGKGRTDERLCLEKHDNKWEVYFAERGVKTTHEIFDSEKNACWFIHRELTCEKAVKRFKKAFKDIFADDVILEDVYCCFSSRGHFTMTYKYLPLNYSIFIENERTSFGIRIIDEEGAWSNLYGIEKYDNDWYDCGRPKYENIESAVLLLKKVLIENKFFRYIYICKGETETLYRKNGDKLEEIRDIRDM